MYDDRFMTRCSGSLHQQVLVALTGTLCRVARCVCSAYKPVRKLTPSWQGRRCASRCIPRLVLRTRKNVRTLRLRQPSQTYCEV